MYKYLLIFLLVFPFSTYADQGSNAEKILSLLSVAKTTGMCGVFGQMAIFQQSTKMPGGDEFVIRFVTTEAARLGHTFESLMAACPVITKKYNDTVSVLQSKD